MEQLIQALTAYTTALEQKLSALEVRVAQLEQQIEEANEAIGRLGERLEAKGEMLEDPEVEILKEKRKQLAEELARLETLEITDDAPISTEEPVVELEPEPVVEEEPEEIVEEYTGPTADDLRREAEEFKRQWEIEKQQLLASTEAEAEKLEKIRKRHSEYKKNKKAKKCGNHYLILCGLCLISSLFVGRELDFD